MYSKENEKIIEEIHELAKNKNVLVLSTKENLDKLQGYKVIDIGSKNNLLEISHRIFSALRSVDKYDVDLAIIEGVEESGIGLAIMNRLIRACEYNYKKIE